MRPVERVRRFGRCAICKRRAGDVMIPVHPGATRADGRGEREEPWCVPCAEAVLEYHRGPSIWYNVEIGWLPKQRIPL